MLETEAVDPFVGLDDAVTSLPATAVAARERAARIAFFVLIGTLQLAWLGAILYAADVFLAS